jgi:hypothetical protein
MERRSFLGSLLALPILAGLNRVEEKALENIQPNTFDGNTFVACSGTFERMSIVSGSGTLPPGCCGPFIRREDLIPPINFRTICKQENRKDISL